MPGRQTRALISAQQVLFPRPQAMMRSSPFSPRLALVFDFATRGRNCLARAFGYTKSLYSYCTVKFARQDNLSFANFFADDVSFLKCCKIHNIAFNFGQFVQSNFGNITLLARCKRSEERRVGKECR